MSPVPIKTVRIDQALRRLRSINEEICYRNFFEGRTFQSGLIAFRSGKKADSRQIKHTDKDVLCHVLKGRGRLRVGKRSIRLAPGMICHIPRGTPHDFAAGRKAELFLFYFLIETRHPANRAPVSP